MNFLYPHSSYTETDLDYIIKLVRQNNGLHLDISGNQLLLKTLDGTTVSSVTVHYADTAGTANTAVRANSASFADTAGTANSANTASEASHALTSDSATTAGTAVSANTATVASTATEANHAVNADTANLANRAILADNATHADTTDSVVHAEKAIESITISGNTVIFRAYDGTETALTIPYAVKANKDDLGNIIKNSYVNDVVDENGVLKFLDAEGNTLVSLTPSSQIATNDSYNNLIADFIKTVTVSQNSNYVTFVHGTGETDTIIINYSERAYKDTNDNVIKNTYIKSLAIEEDANTGHYNLIAYNGDNPSAEIFRLEVNAYKAQLADEATHASEADYATNSGHANNADSAIRSNTAVNGHYIIKLEDDPNSPGDLLYVDTYDSEGNVIPIEDIRQDNLFNSYIQIYHSSYTPSWSEYYTIIEYRNTGSTSPFFFYGIQHPVEGIGSYDINKPFTSKDIKVINLSILNGVVIEASAEDITLDMSFDTEAVVISSNDNILNLAVNGTATATTELSYSEWEHDVSNGIRFFKVKVGDYPNNDITANVNYNNGDLEFIVWDKSASVFKRYVITAGNADDELTITRTY